MVEWKIKQSVTLSDNYIMKTLLTAVTLLDKITGVHFLLFRAWAIPLKRGGGNQPNGLRVWNIPKKVGVWKNPQMGDGKIQEGWGLENELGVKLEEKGWG